MGSLDRINALAYEAALNLAASSPRADYTPGQLPALPLPLQGTDSLIIWRSAAGQTYQVPASSLTALIAGTNGPQVQPSGRLTLTSGVPVLTADVVNAGIILFTPYHGNLVPIFNGVTWVNTAFAETALTLSAALNTTGNVYDVFGFINALGVFALVAGPAWTTPASSRGVGAGTTQIVQQNGLWVNANPINGNNGATITAVAALNGLYLGSFFANGNAQCTMNFLPAAAAGGSNNILGLYNAYNQKRINSLERDSTSAYAYTSAASRAADGSNSNRVTFLDGLQQSPISIIYQVRTEVVAANASTFCFIGVNSTSANVGSPAVMAVPNSALFNTMQLALTTTWFNTPLLGLNFAQALESGDGVNANLFNVAAQNIFTVSLDM